MSKDVRFPKFTQKLGEEFFPKSQKSNPLIMHYICFLENPIILKHTQIKIINVDLLYSKLKKCDAFLFLKVNTSFDRLSPEVIS